MEQQVYNTESGEPDMSDYQFIKRDGSVIPFDLSRIQLAITKAFLATAPDTELLPAHVRETSRTLALEIAHWILHRQPKQAAYHIEDIQDRVELALMRAGEHDAAKAYVLYRERRHQERLQSQATEVAAESEPAPLHIINRIGNREPLDTRWLEAKVRAACEGLSPVIDPLAILASAVRDLYDGVPVEEVDRALVMAARASAEREPDASFVAARLLLHEIRREAMGDEVVQSEMAHEYPDYFKAYIQEGIAAGLLNPALAEFDLDRIASGLCAENDLRLDYLGLQTLYDRYFLHIEERRIELPQAFFMRVAMGLALNESDREARAIEFYNVLSRFDFMSSTPTLFNAGTLHSQLSSCYLTTVSDDLDGIYQAIKENAMLQKYAGGLGNDWTPVRAMGARIKGTNGKSQGVVPFLKVVNDTAVAVNQGGKRKGAVCAYLETWHLDVEEFLELRKNTGDDRRRTHDMNTANWVPDLFMRRVMENAEWTLFSPSDAPDLHDRYGQAFEEAYVRYEAMVDAGIIKHFKRIPATQLWRKMLSMLFETGHPWITFKDPCNIRSPQQHAGVVHSSNLCTEITLNTSETEIAVCNLGSVNLVAHLARNDRGEWVLDADKLRRTIRTGIRMLDNVVDVNFYAVDKARNSNQKHRPVGLGIMGFQDCLQKMGIPYASEAAVQFADQSMERVAYCAYLASSELAKERGAYESYKGSLWDRGILPMDSIDLLQASRQEDHLQVDRSSVLDWTEVREHIQRYGMRNSNCIAIAPTATISNIVGVSASIEPAYQNLYVKSNLSGEFTMVNRYLVDDLKRLGLWDEVMISDIKYFDGALAEIERIPAALRTLYATAFEMDPVWLVECASRRQKWIDQGQSLNIYMAGASGKKLDDIYKLAWVRGLKTTYYLRTMGATRAEKSTGKGGELNAVSAVTPDSAVAFCAIDNPDCEACQ